MYNIVEERRRRRRRKGVLLALLHILGGGSNRVSRPSTLLNEKRAGDTINVNEVLRITLTML